MPRLAELVQQGALRRGALADAELHEPEQRLDRDRRPPAVHGISGNHFLGHDGRGAPADRSAFLRAETIPNAFHAAGVPRARA